MVQRNAAGKSIRLREYLGSLTDSSYRIDGLATLGEERRAAKGCSVGGVGWCRAIWKFAPGSVVASLSGDFFVGSWARVATALH